MSDTSPPPPGITANKTSRSTGEEIAMPIQTTTLVRAFATLTADADADIVEAETLVIGGKTYTFDATLDSDGDVFFVTAFAPNMVALVHAINLTGTPGTHYDDAMTKNAYCFAVLSAAGVATIYSRVAGAIGNLITITVGSSDVVLTDDSSGKLKLGAGSIDDEINALQSSAQVNSEVLAFLHAMEVDPNL